MNAVSAILQTSDHTPLPQTALRLLTQIIHSRDACAVNDSLNGQPAHIVLNVRHHIGKEGFVIDDTKDSGFLLL